jgi:predicted ribosome quality control (RQC) complex YloA/Tae2 family protein
MAKQDHFLQGLRRTLHVKQTQSHVEAPSEKTIEALEAERARLEVQKAKEEIAYWEERRQANSTAGVVQFGLGSNQKRYGTRCVLPRKRRPHWK